MSVFAFVRQLCEKYYWLFLLCFRDSLISCFYLHIQDWSTLCSYFLNGDLTGGGERVRICEFSPCALYHDADNPNMLEEGTLPLLVVWWALHIR